MTHPQQVNPALARSSETELEKWDRSQRGRRYARLAAKYGALTRPEHEQHRTLLAERRALEAEERAAEERRAGSNVRRMPGAK
jgi:hypothetical protein